MRLLPGFATALVLLVSGPSAADPLRVTDGTIVFTDEPGQFEVGGAGFQVHVGWGPSQVGGIPFGDHCTVGCAAGTTVDLGTTSYTFSPNFQAAAATINGVTYPSVYTAGQVTFSGPRFAAPDFIEDANAEARGPFVFNGTLMVFLDPSHSGPPLFASDLVGAGTATAFGSVGGPGAPFFLIRGDDVHFTFSPVPEPSTMLLLASGLAATLVRGRRLRDVRVA